MAGSGSPGGSNPVGGSSHMGGSSSGSGWTSFDLDVLAEPFPDQDEVEQMPPSSPQHAPIPGPAGIADDERRSWAELTASAEYRRADLKVHHYYCPAQ